MPIPKWMLEDLKFSDTEVAALDPLFTPERVTALEAGHLRQSDYSKQMDALKKGQTDLEAANERLNGELAAWATAQANGEELTKKQQKALNDAEQTALRLQQTVRSLAVAAGQDPEKALEGITVADPAKKTGDPAPTSSIDTDNFLTRDAGARLATLSLALATTVPAIAHEHFQLTGETLDTEALGREILTRIQTPGNKKATDVREVWQEIHGITDKRTAASKAKYDKDIADAELRGRNAALTDANLPGPHHATGRPQSPVVARFAQGSDHKSAVNRPAPGGTVNAAVAALRTGKYRQAPAAAGAASK